MVYNFFKITAISLFLSFISQSLQANPLTTIQHYENLESGFFYQPKGENYVFYFAKKQLSFKKHFENPNSKHSIVDMTLKTGNISFNEAKSAYPKWKKLTFVPLSLEAKKNCALNKKFENLVTQTLIAGDTIGSTVSGVSDSFICYSQLLVKSKKQDQVIKALEDALYKKEIYRDIFEFRGTAEVQKDILSWNTLNKNIEEIDNSSNTLYKEESAIFLSGLGFHKQKDSEKIWKSLPEESKLNLVTESTQKNFKKSSDQTFQFEYKDNEDLGKFNALTLKEIVIKL